jgi:putative oxidoreductase
MVKLTSTFPDLSKLLLRLVAGSSFVFHGSQKLFSAFNGPGMEGFTKFIESQGIPYPELNAWLAAGAEFFCGIALIIGLFARWASVPLIFVMGTAIYTVTWKKGFNIGDGGFEYNAVLIALLLSIFLAGPGKYSIRD